MKGAAGADGVLCHAVAESRQILLSTIDSRQILRLFSVGGLITRQGKYDGGHTPSKSP